MLVTARPGYRELQDLLGARRIRQFVGGHVTLARLHSLLDPAAELFHIHVQVRQDRRRHPLALPDQTQEDVLGPYIVVTQARSLLASHGEDLAYSISEVAVHRLSSGWPG